VIAKLSNQTEQHSRAKTPYITMSESDVSESDLSESDAQFLAINHIEPPAETYNHTQEQGLNNENTLAPVTPPENGNNTHPTQKPLKFSIPSKRNTLRYSNLCPYIIPLGPEYLRKREFGSNRTGYRKSNSQRHKKATKFSTRTAPGSYKLSNLLSLIFTPSHRRRRRSRRKHRRYGGPSHTRHKDRNQTSHRHLGGESRRSRKKSRKPSKKHKNQKKYSIWEWLFQKLCFVS
jgi:hypothetical protein